MSAYVSLIRMRMIHGLQYRAAALAGIVTQFAFGFMYVLQYLAFFRTDPSAFPMGISQIVSYVWIQEALLALFAPWFLEREVISAIESGQISYDLSRPMDLYGKWYCQNMAIRLSRAGLRCLPILIVARILPDPYKLSLPSDLLQFLLFCCSSALALLVTVAFGMLLCTSAFYTLSSIGTRIVGVVLTDFLSGGVIPLPFFPDGFRQIAQILPFAAMQNMPLQIYSGHISGSLAVTGIVFQLCWLIILVIIGKLWMRAATKRVIVQGG